jgi:2,4-dienoyl-CoA reductase-like NADH-dependent reductase (Old Yellow Enzyme family)
MTDRQLIGSPYTLPCGYTLPNRMVKASLEEDLADPTNSYPPMSPMFKNLYGRWSRAKYGMILTGHIVVTRGHVGLPGDVCAEKRDFNDPKAVEAWKEYARVCKSGNPETAIVAQINHVGQYQSLLLSGLGTVH